MSILEVETKTEKSLDEKFCHECGAKIKAKAEICPKCGVRQTPATLAPKRYIAWNKKTGLFLGSDGFGFTESRKDFSPRLSETELLVVRYQWKNTEWELVGPPRQDPTPLTDAGWSALSHCNAPGYRKEVQS